MNDYRPDAIMSDAVSRILDCFDFDNPRSITSQYRKVTQRK